MDIEFITQPDIQLGRLLLELLDTEPAAKQVIFVSAFTRPQTIIRIKQPILKLKQNNVDIRFILGIDLGGTSQEALFELLKWGIDVRIVKHRSPGHTFHPKLYLFQWADKAKIIVGSNNITDGGFFNNYESAICVTYQLPEELEDYNSACGKLRRFIEPDNAVAYSLTSEFLNKLIDWGGIPTEAVARRIRKSTGQSQKETGAKGKLLFGVEPIPSPPPLPASFIDERIKDNRNRKRSKNKTAHKSAEQLPPISTENSDDVFPIAFYMTLPKLQGKNIPGESRIPLEAIELAKDFWGWPEEYLKEVSPRSGKERIYWNWKPLWRVWSVESPENVMTPEVRMYMYENSSDFRFYARPLVKSGGDLGDVVRIRRVAEPDVRYECVLARRGTKEFDEWIKFCTHLVHNSKRRFGFA